MRRRTPRVEQLEPRCMLSATVCESAEIGYFLHADAACVERYDIAQEQWLAPIALSDDLGTPTVAHADADGLYVAYGTAVYRYNLDGTGQTHLLDAEHNVVAIHTDGNLLFVNHSSKIRGFVISVDKETDTIVDTIGGIGTIGMCAHAVFGSSIASEANRIFGRSKGISPCDITYVEYNDDGVFTEYGNSPYHGDYADASQTWVFPDGSKVVDDAGLAYSTSDLTWLNALGNAITDIDFTNDGLPIILKNRSIIAYSANLLPTSSKGIPHVASKIFVNDTNILAFSVDASQSSGYCVDVVAIDKLHSASPGKAVDPEGLAYTPTSVAIASDGTVLLLSKKNNSIFRWDPVTETYGETIPLLGNPRYMAYSADTNTVYLAGSSIIDRLDLSAAKPTPKPFAILAEGPIGLVAVGEYLFAADTSGGYYMHYTFAPDGTRVENVECDGRSTEYIWSDANQKIYYLRDGISPNDLLSEEINADGVTYPSESPGGIGDQEDSPLHHSSGFTHPIRVSPDGSIIVLGSGVIHDGSTLKRLSVSLSNTIIDAAWLGGVLYTIREDSGVTELQRWTSSTFELVDSLQIGGTLSRLLALDDDTLLAISIDSNGIPVFQQFVNEPTTVALTDVVDGLADGSALAERFAVARIATTGDVLSERNLTLDGPDAALFEIDGEWLYLRAGSVLDSEASPQIEVTLTIDDPALGDSPEDSTKLAIPLFNITASADAGGPYAIGEGESLVVSASLPAEVSATYLWDLDGDGDFDENITGPAVTVPWSVLQGLGLDGPTTRTIAVEVSTPTGTGTATTSLEVTNAAPVAVAFDENKLWRHAGAEAGVAGVVADPSSLDVLSGTVEWGDGTSETLTLVVTDGQAAFDAAHAFAADGAYTITVTVADDDGGSLVLTRQVVVGSVSWQDGVLDILGSAENDTLTLGIDGENLSLVGNFLANVPALALADIQTITLSLLDGNDTLVTDPAITVPITGDGGTGDDGLQTGAGEDWLYGGDGNDTLSGGVGLDRIYGQMGDDRLSGGADRDLISGQGGNDWLDGEDGHDILYGNGGNDFLFGHAGKDRLFGHEGDDMLVGGDGNDRLSGSLGQDVLLAGQGADWVMGHADSDLIAGGATAYDDDQDALDALMAAWLAEDASLSDRIKTIAQGFGSDAMYALSATDTVLADAAQDNLAGNGGADWYLADAADLIATGGGDRLTRW